MNREKVGPIWAVLPRRNGHQQSVWFDETRQNWRKRSNSKRKTLRSHRNGIKK